MMCYNFGNQKVIFLQGMGDGIGHEKKTRKIRESLPRLPQEKETQMLYSKWVMGHTVHFHKFPNRPPGVYFLQTSDVGGGVIGQSWFNGENSCFFQKERIYYNFGKKSVQRGQELITFHFSSLYRWLWKYFF